MYAINPLSRFVLITPDECTVKLPNASLDSTKWIAVIEVAEQRFAMEALGWNLYNDIIEAKNIYVDSGNIASLQTFFTNQFGIDPVTSQPKVILQVGQIVNSIDLPAVSAAYRNLWNQVLWNYVFNSVMLLALTDNYAQFTSSGVQKSNPIDSALGTSTSPNVGISLKDLQYLNNRQLLDRINVIEKYLNRWLCANITQYSLYPRSKCNSSWDYHRNEPITRTTDLVMIYDDVDECGCWNKDNNCNNGYVPVPVPTPPPVTATCGIRIEIATTPDGSLFMLCNLSTIQAQYTPSATTLTIADLVGKYVSPAGATYNGMPVDIGPTNTGSVIGYDQGSGTFNRTIQGGWNDGDIFIFSYTETMS
jgi:hypothetical protein